MASKLSPKQQRFVEEYLIDRNATKAAIRAGYKESEYTGTNASKILKNTKVKRAVEQAIAEQSKRTGITADRVLEELAKIAFANAIDIIDPSDASVRESISREDTAAIQEIKVKTSSIRKIYRLCQ